MAKCIKCNREAGVYKYCIWCESKLRSEMEAKQPHPRITPELAKRIAETVASELNLYSGFLTDMEAVNRIAHIVERVGNADA